MKTQAKTRIKTEEFEAKRWPYYLLLPILWLLTFWVFLKKKINMLLRKNSEVGLLVFDGLGKYGKVVRRNAAGWKAVDLIYNRQFGQDRSIGGRLDDFWFESMNCQAARNRFKLARRELQKSILQFANQEGVRIVSLASGTGQIEAEVIAKSKEAGVKVNAILIDIEKDALKRAEEFIAINDVSDEIVLKHADASKAPDIVKDFKPHIFNMIAFLDYLKDEDAIAFISKIYDSLEKNGLFITSNTIPNVEMGFVKWVVGWNLIYRKPKDIESIIRRSGFTQCEIFTEPLKIQSVVVAKK